VAAPAAARETGGATLEPRAPDEGGDTTGGAFAAPGDAGDAPAPAPAPVPASHAGADLPPPGEMGLNAVLPLPGDTGCLCAQVGAPADVGPACTGDPPLAAAMGAAAHGSPALASDGASGTGCGCSRVDGAATAPASTAPAVEAAGAAPCCAPPASIARGGSVSSRGGLA
jgi:hypothetical protein